MLAAYATGISPDNPLVGLEIGDVQIPPAPDGWVPVRVKAAALNHHDLWSLRGYGLDQDRLPMVLGCDGAGIGPDGAEVVIHAVITDPTWPGDEALDPSRTLLSEFHPGTLAETVFVPADNLIPKPPSFSFEEAACLPTAYLTAYRMLFVRADLIPGHTVLIQGAAGGLASAAIVLARGAGLRVWVTGRDERKRAFAQELGAHATYEPGARLPDRVDAVLESVGEASWAHSLKSVKPGGRIVVAGGTSGLNPAADLARIFIKQIDVRGSTMGSRADLTNLIRFLETTGVRPEINRTMALADAAAGFEAMANGDVLGKIVVQV